MIFYNLFVAPIEMVVDWVFTFFTIKFSSFGVIGAIFGVSLVINFLALPIYNVADALQAKERKIAKEMEPRIKRIKMAFKGDERFMMLQTYYRECKYNPIYTLRSSLSILIEIPFFIAAYHYLSHAEALKNVSFWIFKDLGAADSLSHIGSFPINVLPILMTVINLVSGAIYSKDTTLREKIQIYVLAAVFLALLYNSPSGLVIYWILNNLFSLAKNVVLKMKNPGKVLQVIIDAILALFALYFLFFNDGSIKKRILLAVFAAAVILFPVLKKMFARHCERSEAISSAGEKSQFALFIFSALGLALLCGFYLPSSAIATSPTEFSFLGEGADSPLTYVWSSLFTFLGFFAIWPTLIYFMFGDKVKKWESALFFAAFLAALADVFIFKADYGTVSILFRLDDSDVLKTNAFQRFVPFLLVILVFILNGILGRFKKLNIATTFVFAIFTAEVIISFKNVSSINRIYLDYVQRKSENVNLSKSDELGSHNEIKPVYHFTKSGRNVVVLFLDRGINSFFSYALKDLPELREQMRGFVYYPNTLSFSTGTLLGAPAMLGGYEYTPEEINKRDNELLRMKHNEATLLVPTLFADKDYEATLSDPIYPNFYNDWKKDFSVFEGRKNISVIKTSEKYANNFINEINFYEKIENFGNMKNSVSREIRNFSILQILFPFLRLTFYGNFKKDLLSNSMIESYLQNLSALYYLPQLTELDAKKNQYFFIGNTITHDPCFVDVDFFQPSSEPTFHGSYKTDDENIEMHYQCFVAAFKQIGKWFDFLRKNNIYDNTRIIIVSDHGFKLKLSDFSEFEDSSVPSSYNPIFLFKDFNSNSKLSTDNTFMTNADALFLAIKNLKLSDENPFTHKKLTQKKKDGITVYPMGTEHNIQKLSDANQFPLSKKSAYHVHDNIFNEKNWGPLLDWEKEYNSNGGEK